MSLLGFARSLAREYYELMRVIRNYSSTINETEIKNASPENNFYLGFYSDKSYLLRKHQDRHPFSRCTNISARGLEIRLKNQKIKNEKAEREKRIQEAFSRKIKNRRWMKRHHQINRSCPYVVP
ncbi:MAG: hypothetical protein NTU63_03675 [Candidatus Pacearchaeota archaeon]|nr:hypothetical protein [Candidatus Pacearchaeota archaeon]